MKIVTAGKSYMDIDAYAGIIAYAELLELLGQNGKAVSSAVLNESITTTVLGWGNKIVDTYEPSDDDEFIIIDVSDPNYLDKYVDIQRVIEVIDHHPAHDKYWQAKSNVRTQIEKVGAACTQVYELWIEAGKLSEMSELSARLLITGILDNTLNFGAQITNLRDHKAYKAMLPIANLPEDWPAKYFSECQIAIEEDLNKAIYNDTKTGMVKLPLIMGQMVIWDAKAIVVRRFDEIVAAMSTEGGPWLMNAVSISDNKSIFIATDEHVKQQIGELLNVRFEGNIAQASRMWLRKEIQAEALK